MFIVGIRLRGDEEWVKGKKIIKGSFYSREVVWALRDEFYQEKLSKFLMKFPALSLHNCGK